MQLILLFTWIDYSGNKYGDYEFPAWANALGWAITFSSVILIPVVAVVKVYQETGTFSAVSSCSLSLSGLRVLCSGCGS